jgi:hypothetical protein
MTHDPVRWLESNDALARDEQRAFATLSARAPSSEQKARMLERMAALPLMPGSAPQAAVNASRASVGWWVLGGAAVLALLALCLLARPQSAVVPRASLPTQVPGAAAATPRTFGAEGASAQQGHAEHVAGALHALESAGEPGPSQAARARSATTHSSRGKAARTVVAPEIADPMAELALLTPARKLLTTNPERTLALSEEHAQRFPRGTFAEERAFLRVEALLRLGQRARAESAARVFRRAYARSTYHERLEQLLSRERAREIVPSSP